MAPYIFVREGLARVGVLYVGPHRVGAYIVFVCVYVFILSPLLHSGCIPMYVWWGGLE